jgi:aspartate racemase
MAKHIGIAACSAEGAALCYRTICKEGAELMGEHAHPEITMHTNPLNVYMDYIYKDDWDGVGRLMIASDEILAKAGADFVICPDNTIHQAFEQVKAGSPLPWLHIAEAVAAEAQNQNYSKLGITGTRYLMEGPVYPQALTAAGLEYAIPDEEQRIRINDIIFKELVYGEYKSEARDYFNQVMANLKAEGCDAAVMGCTEIPLLVIPEQAPLPTLDSTRLLARAALHKAVSEG